MGGHKDVVVRSKGRSYKSILSALNDGMAIKDLRKAFNRARKSAMWAAASADTTQSSNLLKEEGLKVAIQTHLRMAA